MFLMVVFVGFAGAEGGSEQPESFDNFSSDDYGAVTLLQRSDGVDTRWRGVHDLLLQRFGIEIDADFLPRDAFNSKFNLLVAAGEIPDMAAGLRSFPIAQFNEWGTAGILYPVDELVDHAPELNNFFEEFPYIKEFATAPDGHLYHVPGGYDSPGYHGTVVRRDLLDEHGYDLDEVEDFVDFRDMLRALQDASNGAPVLGTLQGVQELLELPFRALGMDDARNLTFNDESGEFYYPFGSDEAYFAVDWLRNLYADGIIDPEAFSSPARSTTGYFDRYTAMLYGSVHLAYHYEHQAGLSGYPIDLEAVRPPAIKGTRSAWRTPRVITHPEVVLNRQLADEKAEAIMRMLDWLRTDEGYASSLYGVRGENWEFVDGVPRQINPLTAGAAGPHIGSFALRLSRKLWDLRNPWVDEQMKADFLPKYLPLFGRPVYPELLFAPEEARAAQDRLHEMNELVFRWYLRMIVGAVPMSDWPLFLDELETYDVDGLEQDYNEPLFRQTNFIASGGAVGSGGTSSKSSTAQSSTSETSTTDSIDWAKGALPTPTSLMIIDTAKLLPFGEDSIKLAEADGRLSDMLDRAGYRERGYYTIADGYLVVTSMDVYNCNTHKRIRDMGALSVLVTIAKEKLAEAYDTLTEQAQDRELFARLLERVTNDFNLEIEECARLLMFAIENGNLKPDSDALTGIELYQVLNRSLSSGLPSMPTDVAEKDYPQPAETKKPKFKVTFLVYQFETPRADSEQPSSIRFVPSHSNNKPCAYEHLIGAGLRRLVTWNQRLSLAGC